MNFPNKPFSFLHVFEGSHDRLLISTILQAHRHSRRAEVPGWMQGYRNAGMGDAGAQAGTRLLLQDNHFVASSVLK